MKPTTPDSDLTLVQRAQQGQTSAFEVLVIRHLALVRRIVAPYTRNSDDVEDLVQETFLNAFTRLKTLTDGARFAHWLAVIAKRTALDWQRQTALQLPLLWLEEDKVVHDLNAVALQAQRECHQVEAVRSLVGEALRALPESQRHAVRLHYLEGYDYRETALLLQLPESAVRGRLDRARQTLRRELSTMLPKTQTPPPASLKHQLQLNRGDVVALQKAALFTLKESADLRAVALSPDGRIVATDTHRMFVHHSQTASNWPSLLIDSSGLRSEFLSQEAVLRWNDLAPLEDGDNKIITGTGELALDNTLVPLEIVGGKFPDWKRVVPTSHKISVKAKRRLWEQQVQDLLLFWESNLASPADTISTSNPPKAILQLVPEHKRIVLELAQETDPNDAEATRSLVLTFAAEFAPDSLPLTIHANLFYVRDALHALNGNSDDHIEFCGSGPLNPFILRDADKPGTFLVIMPMSPHHRSDKDEPNV